jgi:hypothetical protein
MMKNVALGILIGLIVGGVAIQFISYGHDHTNPAVAAVEPQWDSQQTRDLAVRACFDCHSDQTTWPWYSNIAPLSWLIQHDVQQGRAQLNFSQWGSSRRGGDNAAEQIQRGTMPQWYYVMLHPSAGLSDIEKQTLIRGLNATTGGGG